MFADGDEVRCLVATESKVYQLMYTNACEATSLMQEQA